MRYRYRNDDELKDSGVEWLGKIPKDWEVKRNRHIIDFRRREVNEYEDTTVLSLTVNGVKVKKDLSFGKSTESYIGHQLVYPGDIVFTPRDFDQTPILSGVSDYYGCISNLYFVLKCKNDINNYFVDYFWWGLKYKVDFFKNFSYGIRYGYNYDQFKDLLFLKPNYIEQEKIANFLDEKTSQFDLIISKKEKLIDILEEAKKSLISEVVTGKVKIVRTDDGYELVKRSSEEMKDSGVEWLGEIPKDWDVKKLKHISIINPPKSSVKKFVDEDIEVSFVPMESVRLGNINLDKTKKISEVIDGYTLFEDNDIVMAKVTPCFENRNIAICKGLKNKIGFGSSELNTIRLNDDKDIKFMFYHLQEQKFMDTATYQMTGAGGLKRVPTSFLLNAQFTYPSDSEKEIIVYYLENYIDKINKISEKTKLQIEKLKEAKQSLISEAVTGKIEILD